MTLEEFRHILEEDGKNLNEEEVEILFRVSTSFADLAYKKWVENKRQLVKS